jgi:hypothetical protein
VSASKKLRALMQMQDVESMMALLTALPKIAALAEAVEVFVAAVDHSIELGVQPALAPATSERVRLDELVRPALAALEEAL